MKSVRLFAVTVLCALTLGTVSATATAVVGTEGADVLATSSTDPTDSGWGRIPQ
ncbi:hypothetical protein [Streptomyces sp. DSM 40484]|jgi:hypothetical protein|uniref:hypothetical protein n=1 Tax=Streptomyces kroppenstedtii TaxID=3051181 RepID=UPI0028D3AEB0|nr:hypothetical protein [Streptomyces sp. DSM 40484]